MMLLKIHSVRNTKRHYCIAPQCRLAGNAWNGSRHHLPTRNVVQDVQDVQDDARRVKLA